MAMPPPLDEADAVRARYARRDGSASRYSLLDAAALLERQGRQRALVRMLVQKLGQKLGRRSGRKLGQGSPHDGSRLQPGRGLPDVSRLKLLEVGCGSGANLLELLQLGFAPEHLQGIELLPERHAAARRVLPAALRLWLGDATQPTQAPVPPHSQDLLLVATVFSSLLDDAFQQDLAQTMWQWLVPGGAVICYDFTVNNPRNRDVRGVPLKRLQALFPAGRIHSRRLTLAPPLARLACRIHPALHGALNTLPLLRTHVLAWIEKPA